MTTRWHLPDGAEIVMRNMWTGELYLARVVDGSFVRVEGPTPPPDPQLEAIEETHESTRK